MGTPSPSYLEPELLLYLGNIGVPCESSSGQRGPFSARHCSMPPPGGAGAVGPESGAGPSNFGEFNFGESNFGESNFGGRETRGDRAFWGGFWCDRESRNVPCPPLSWPSFGSSFSSSVLFKTNFEWIEMDFGISGSAMSAFCVRGWIRGLPGAKRDCKGGKSFGGMKDVFLS